MFIVALFTIAKIWQKPGCLSVDKWIKKRWYIFTIEYFSAIKKNEILPYATTWMNLEGIVLSGVSQTEKNKCHMIARHVESKKQTNKQTKNKNKKNRNKLIGTDNILRVTRWEGGWVSLKKAEGIKKYKLVVTE